MVATYPQSPNGAIPPDDAGLIYVPTADDVMEMVDTHERDVKALTSRMERDYSLYRLSEHVNKDSRTGEALRNYAVYTSNSPRVFADKIISWLAQAVLLIRVPHIESPVTHPDEVDNLKERFAIGCLTAADERLRRRLEPSLRRQLARSIVVRGGYIGGRALLVNQPDGSTYADICPWDPMHIHWGVNYDGLEWVGYKIKRTAAQIRREYPELQLPEGASRRSNSINTDQEGMWLVDWYGPQVNMALIDGQIAKPPTLHGSPRVPCFLTLVGDTPILQSQSASNLMADVGESVFAGVRDIYEKKNDLMSIMLEIVSRSRRQPVVTESADGKKTLPEDPWAQGTEIAMRTGERIYTLELQRLAQDTGAYLTALLGEEQRATLPFSSYGETPFQLSGFAITQLRQATETVLSSRLEALEGIYSQIVNLLYDQFMTGAFSGMRLSGRDRNRNYFSMTLSADQIANSCDYSLRLAYKPPQDDSAKWQQAEVAKRTELMSDVEILENVLEVQDAQQTMDKMKLQRAEQLLPEAMLYELMEAAARRGDQVTANTYLAEYMRVVAMKMGIMPGETPDEGGGPGKTPTGRGMTPNVLPHAATGAAPQPETSNDGPSRVAPRTPRPRARGQKA